jgi:hypothetical protein
VHEALSYYLSAARVRGVRGVVLGDAVAATTATRTAVPARPSSIQALLSLLRRCQGSGIQLLRLCESAYGSVKGLVYRQSLKRLKRARALRDVSAP